MHTFFLGRRILPKALHQSFNLAEADAFIEFKALHQRHSIHSTRDRWASNSSPRATDRLSGYGFYQLREDSRATRALLTNKLTSVVWCSLA